MLFKDGDNNETVTNTILKFVDDSKLLKEVSSLEDIATLQDDLDYIYKWTDLNHMRWNSLKFLMLSFGSNDIRSETNVFAPNLDEIIEVKEVLRDLQ